MEQSTKSSVITLKIPPQNFRNYYLLSLSEGSKKNTNDIWKGKLNTSPSVPNNISLCEVRFSSCIKKTKQYIVTNWMLTKVQ